MNSLNNCIDDVSLTGNLSYLFLEPEALAPTLDLLFDVSNINMLVSDYLLLSAIQLAVANLEAYNDHDDGALDDNEIQASDIAAQKGISLESTKSNFEEENKKLEDEQDNTDAEKFVENGVEYVIVPPQKPQIEVDASKIEKWKAQVNFSLLVKLAGVNLSIVEQDEVSKQKTQLIFT